MKSIADRHFDESNQYFVIIFQKVKWSKTNSSDKIKGIKTLVLFQLPVVKKDYHFVSIKTNKITKAWVLASQTEPGDALIGINEPIWKKSFKITYAMSF